MTLVFLAPTGSGKTVLFELAIIKMLSEAQETGQSVKSIYVAPTKVRLRVSVVTVPYIFFTGTLFRKIQRLGEQIRTVRDQMYETVFSPRNDLSAYSGCELTGDTIHFGKSAWGDAKNATIM